ncbi:hypothetical protein [Frigoribacterium endophyticum]|uniref:hypothetical protein n=1 Tax=Frigoribacterium endophyticum TaxID=1522176 RepID=UPI00141EFC9E|nr:hypothetical protein [Frigoribacterium endophyticum]NII52118.1 cytosine/adenosine deaminase-related metal-dependent hydrolase [Frigoribacterium endophyticum]
MKYIVYGESKVMTGDAIAEAVLAYAAALGQNGTTDIVEVPTADDEGSAVTAQLLLGPASQVMIEVAPEDELEPEDSALVEELIRRTAAVGGARFVDAASGHSLDEDSNTYDSKSSPSTPNDPFPTKSRPTSSES